MTSNFSRLVAAAADDKGLLFNGTLVGIIELSSRTPGRFDALKGRIDVLWYIYVII